LTPATSWWHGPAGHFYGCLVDDPAETPLEDQQFEIAARSVIDPATATGKRFSWGVPATKERVESFFTVSYAYLFFLLLLWIAEFDDHDRTMNPEFEKHFQKSLKVNGKNSPLLLVLD
jgi:hypothetical protein